MLENFMTPENNIQNPNIPENPLDDKSDVLSNKRETEPIQMKKEVAFLNNIVIALVFVLFIGFTATFVASTAILIDAWRSDKISQQELINKIIEQNTKIDLLYKQNMENK